MTETFFIAIGSFFLHPLLYIGLAALAVISAFRVSRERTSFHTRVFAKRADFILSFWPSLLGGLLASLVFVAYGLVFPMPVLVLIATASLLLLASGQLKLQSPVYIVGLVSLFLLFMPAVSLPDWMFFQFSEAVLFPSLFLFMGVVLFVQALLIRNNGQTLTSPQLKQGKRGRFIGIHQVKRLWIIPLVVFIPEGMVPTFSNWPVFYADGYGLQPIIIPFIVGFGKTIRSLPKHAIRSEAKQVFGMAVLAICFAVVLYVYPIAWVLAVCASMAIIIQIAFHIRSSIQERSQPAFFTEGQKSSRVVGILPGSPAEKMAIAIGEEIVKVNGQTVYDERTLYQALQLNSVYCKLEVKNLEGEKRFVKGALYSGEHYQLGVLLVRKEEQLIDSIL